MKIAIASENNNVCADVSQCQGFYLYNIDNSSIAGKEFIDNPGEKTEVLTKFLANLNVEVLIVGDMVKTTQCLFKENNITVKIGVTGDIDEAVERYFNSTDN